MDESERQELAIKRILVALDTSSHSLAALQAAVELAARFHAELEGLFVEDADLLRSADHAFSREIGLYSGHIRRIDRRGLELQIRAHGHWARRIFTAAGRRARIVQHFTIVRGEVSAEVLSRAAQSDVLILGRRSRSLILRGALGSTTRAVLTQVTSTALIVDEGGCLGPPFVVLFDGSALAEKALGAALRLVSEADSVIVLLAGLDAPAVGELKSQARAIVEEQDAVVSYKALTRSGLEALAQTLEEEECGTLVVPAESTVLSGDSLAALLDRLQVPALVVR